MHCRLLFAVSVAITILFIVFLSTWDSEIHQAHRQQSQYKGVNLIVVVTNRAETIED